MRTITYGHAQDLLSALLLVNDHDDIQAAFLFGRGIDGREIMIAGKLVQDTGGRFDAERRFCAPGTVWPQAPKPSLTEQIGSFHVEKIDKQLDHVVITYDFATAGLSIPLVDFSDPGSYPERTTGTLTLDKLA